MLFYLPVLSYLIASVAYQLVAKTVPSSTNPFAMLSIVYAIATLLCVSLLIVTKKQETFLEAYRPITWTVILLGIAVVALEGSMIYAYRLGWQISVYPTVVYILAIIVLLFLGFFLFGEKLTIKKCIGVAMCVAGLLFMRAE